MHERRRASGPGGRAALAAYGQLIEQIACPAYCCTPGGTVLYCNSAARRLWGASPAPAGDGCWDGFTALYRTDGRTVEKPASPAALAARTGVAQPPTELVAETADGQKRCVVIHARVIGQADGSAQGQIRDTALWCDPDRLGQALGNALLNASQFSDNGARIALSVAVDGVFLELLVSDHGIGVEADELPRTAAWCRPTAPGEGRAHA